MLLYVLKSQQVLTNAKNQQQLHRDKKRTRNILFGDQWRRCCLTSLRLWLQQASLVPETKRDKDISDEIQQGRTCGWNTPYPPALPYFRDVPFLFWHFRWAQVCELEKDKVGKPPQKGKKFGGQSLEQYLRLQFLNLDFTKESEF